MRRALVVTEIVVTAVMLSLSGCELLFLEGAPDSSPESIFLQTWEFVDREYSYFDEKLGGDTWTDVRLDYEPRVDSDMNDYELFDLLAEMLGLLEDGHVNLRSDFNRSRNWDWYLTEPPHFDFVTLERYYWVKPEIDNPTVLRSGGQEYVGDAFILYDFQVRGESDGAPVGYIAYRSFLNPIDDGDLDYVIRRFTTWNEVDYAGLIIDIRNNGGGTLTNVFTLAERFVDSELKVAEEEWKNGPGHDDFGPREDVLISPPEGMRRYERPVVILTNAHCYSAANYFATLMKDATRQGLDITLVGDTTGGGGGAPAATVLTNRWRLRVSTSRLWAWDEVDGAYTYSAENGVVPHIDVDDIDPGIDSWSIEPGTARDIILDRAVERLSAGIGG